MKSKRIHLILVFVLAAANFTMAQLRSAGGGINDINLSSGQTYSSPIALTSNITFTGRPGETYTLSGVISGGFSLTLAGGGTLILTAANTYSGGTTISAGTLTIGDGTNATASLGTGNLSVSNATLEFNILGASTQTVGTITLNPATINVEKGQVILQGSRDGGVAVAISGNLTLNNNNSGSFVLRGTGRNGDGVGVDIARDITIESTGGATIQGIGDGNAGRRRSVRFNGNATLRSINVWGSSSRPPLTVEALQAPGASGDVGMRQDAVGTITASGGGSVILTASSGWSSSFDAEGEPWSFESTYGTLTLNALASGTDGSAAGYGFDGSKLSLKTYSGGGRIVVNGSPSTPNTTGIYANNMRLVLGWTSDSITFNSNISLTGASTIDVGDGPVVSINGAITGSGSLTFEGPYVLAIHGANSYTGATSITGGFFGGTGSSSASAHTVAAGARIFGGKPSRSGLTGDAGTYTVDALTMSAATSKLAVYGTVADASKVVCNTFTAANGFTVDVLGPFNVPATYRILTVGGTVPSSLPTLGRNDTGATVSFRWSGQDLLMVIGDGIVPAPKGSPIQIVAGAGTIANLSAVGIGIQWYAAATGGTALASTTPLVDGDTYYASQTIAAIESTARLAVAVRKISEPTQTLATGSTVANLVTTPNTGASTRWFAAAAGGTALATTDALANGTYYVEQFEEVGVSTIATGFRRLSGVAIQANGGIVVTDDNDNAVYRMNADGTGKVALGSGFNYPTGVAIQADGRIVVADYGSRTVIRMNADGTSIETLGSGSNLRFDLVSMVIQADGKIVIIDDKGKLVKRMNADGSGVETLGSGLGNPISLAIQSDGRIVFGDLASKTIKRMNADGTGIEIVASGSSAPSDLAIQADGKIVAVYSGDKVVKRMNADGSGIETLASGFSVPAGIAIQADGKILVADGGVVKRISPAYTTNRVAVAVNLVAPGTPPTGLATQVFAGAGTVANLAATGNAIKWYDAAAGGTALAPTTTLVDGAFYYATQTISDTESTTRLAVAVRKIGEATQTFCGSPTVANLASTPSAGAMAQWFTTPAGGIILAANRALQPGTYYIQQTTATPAYTSNRVAVNVVINPTPAKPTITSDGQPVPTLTSSSEAGLSYQWRMDGVAIPNATSVSYAVPATSAQGSYSVVVALNGCASEPSDALTVVPDSTPTGLSPQVFAGAGTVANLSATGANIKWYAAASGGAALAATTALADGSAYFATQTVSGTESTTRLAVAVRKISEATQTFCGAPTVANLVSTPSVGATAQWFTTPAGGIILAANQAIQPGTYYIQQTTPTPAYTSNRVAVNVFINPTPAKPTITSDGQPVPTLTSSSAAGLSYQWRMDGVAIPNATSVSYTVPATNAQGSYSVVATLNGCASEPSDALSVVITGDIATGASMTLSPNPTADVIYLSLEGFSGDKHIAVYDFTGKALSLLRTAAEQTSIDVRSYPTGIYFVRIATDKGISQTRFVKK